ncbi:hypothetical protein D3C81_852950 [compost metagenome]
MGAQPAQHRLGVALGPAPGHFDVPLQSDGFKEKTRPLGSNLGLLLFFHRIKVVEQQSLGFIALGSRDSQRNDGVLADDQRAFLAVGFEIPQPPSLRATGRDVQVHTPAVEQFVGTITRFGRAAFEVAERSG